MIDKHSVSYQYFEREREVRDMLYGLLSDLEVQHDHFIDKRNAGDLNWGTVGDLNHVKAMLQEVHIFLNNEE